jgi:hypothetical protein
VGQSSVGLRSGAVKALALVGGIVATIFRNDGGAGVGACPVPCGRAGKHLYSPYMRLARNRSSSAAVGKAASADGSEVSVGSMYRPSHGAQVRGSDGMCD